MILKSSYFMLRRMFRNYVGMAILMLTPIALITVLGLIADNAVNEESGILMKDEVAVTMMFAFLMFGGFYTMEYIKGDLMSSMKWRMYSLPFHAHTHAYSIILTSALFNVFQSFVIVIYTLIFYNVQWGNLGFVLLALIAVSVVIQLVYVNFVLAMKNYKTAERLGTGFGIACLMLAEVWFPLPNSAPFWFVSTYGNPVSLGQNMIYAIMTGENIEKAIISFVILIALSIALACLAAYYGRRKLV
ncbi:ABC transporter permease [Halalkalibacter okhensis]|uniref:ABC transporter n=1 Tax=Halalkalibacter okhensis TaxID=333138 RepID=A0A0B0IEV1_9BACI|nr:ABC transporter permease [Halalkalibacter okhensis]KHF39357.1 ABC transporter [Halalkalibacter okhensis]